MIRTAKLRTIEKQTPSPFGINIEMICNIGNNKIKVLQQWWEAESSNEISQWVNVLIEETNEAI